MLNLAFSFSDFICFVRNMDSRIHCSTYMCYYGAGGFIVGYTIALANKLLLSTWSITHTTGNAIGCRVPNMDFKLLKWRYPPCDFAARLDDLASSDVVKKRGNAVKIFHLLTQLCSCASILQLQVYCAKQIHINSSENWRTTCVATKTHEALPVNCVDHVQLVQARVWSVVPVP